MNRDQRITRKRTKRNRRSAWKSRLRRLGIQRVSGDSFRFLAGWKQRRDENIKVIASMPLRGVKANLREQAGRSPAKKGFFQRLFGKRGA